MLHCMWPICGVAIVIFLYCKKFEQESKSLNLVGCVLRLCPNYAEYSIEISSQNNER